MQKKLSDEEVLQLTNEIQKARKAKQAYDLYIKDHVESVTKQIFDSIKACSIADTETLISLKGLLTAISSLESSVISDIDTGKLAELTLEKYNG